MNTERGSEAAITTEPVHVHGGSLFPAQLEDAGIPGRRLEWVDVLTEGQVQDLGDAAAERAERVAALRAVGLDAAARSAAQDAALEQAAAEGHELVLWFGDDLFCQLIQLRLLAWLHWLGALSRVRLAGPGPRDPDPGTCRLEAMDAPAIVRAFAARRPVDAATHDTALAAWRAFTSTDWSAIENLVRAGTPGLPALAPALARLAEERPAPDTGLTATEAAVLVSLDAGPADGATLFLRAASLERRRWYTDLMFLWVLRRLAAAPDPAIVLGGGGDALEAVTVHRTRAGDALRQRLRP
ncbi:MAG: hypothetical protein ACREMH_01575 [Gemmatimonadales bacterium]